MVVVKVASFLKKNKLVWGIVVLSLILRLFNISSYMTFLGDEGRDALVWLRMLKGRFTLIGPQTSIGNMYLGPLFYYLMLPFFFLAGGPVGPSVGVALFAGATTFLLWLFGKEWFSEKVGFLAAFFYAISPVAIELSRSSWNPNIMPFFSLLIVWGIWQFWQKNKYYWLAIEGVLISFAVQSHYLGLLLFSLVAFFGGIKLISLTNEKLQNIDRKLTLCLAFNILKKRDLKKFFFWGGVGFLIFLLLTALPLIWFDIRHNFINYKAFYSFFSERQTTVNLKPYKAIPQIWPLWRILVTRILAGKNDFLGFWLSLLTGLYLISYSILTSIHRRIEVNERNAFNLIFLWLVVGLLGMGLYKQHIYDHYFGFLFPAIFLIFAVILENLWKLKIYGKILAGVIFAITAGFSFWETPLKYKPNFQMERTVAVAKKIVEESENKPFNLGMIAKQNYDAGYRYFLEKWGYKPVEIDAQKPQQTITEQLFVVCEEKECNPTTHPQAEIANFGWSKIWGEWSFPWGVKLYKLVHYVDNKK